jgi:hypothetical protein
VVSRTDCRRWFGRAAPLLGVAMAAEISSACGRENLELFPGYGEMPDEDAAASEDAGTMGSDATILAPKDASADSRSTSRPDSGVAPRDSAAAPPDAVADDDRVVPVLLLEAGVPCKTDSDCHGENHRCQTGLHVCVQCIGDPKDCATQGNESKCNLVNYTCAVPCAPDGGCSEGDVCDSQGVCADCLASSHCPANQPRCVIEECVCLSNADCDGGVCGPDQTCR